VQVVGIGDAVHVASGGQHTCALRTDGTIACWGSNLYGQCALDNDGEAIQQPASGLAAGFAGVLAIQAGRSHSCALLDGGTVRCWGHDTFGELGDGENGVYARTYNPEPSTVVGVSGASLLSTENANHACVVLLDATVKCWGWNDDGQVLGGNAEESGEDVPVLARGLSGVVRVAVGYRFSCALLDDHSIWCWGSNEWGSLGNGAIGAEFSSVVPVQVLGVSE